MVRRRGRGIDGMAAGIRSHWECKERWNSINMVSRKAVRIERYFDGRRDGGLVWFGTKRAMTKQRRTPEVQGRP